jgi:hypothetical protein
MPVHRGAGRGPLHLLLAGASSGRGTVKLCRLQSTGGPGGRGFNSFPFQLNLSSSVHRITQIN